MKSSEWRIVKPDRHVPNWKTKHFSNVQKFERQIKTVPCLSPPHGHTARDDVWLRELKNDHKMSRKS